MTSLVLSRAPDLRLRLSCREVPEDREGDALAMGRLMREAMNEWSGVGLAANQCGLTWRIFAFDDRKGHRGIALNPYLVDADGSATEDEGCLSFPGLYVPTSRAARVKWGALGRKPVWSDGLLARIVQHEIDHLNAVLLDRRAA